MLVIFGEDVRHSLTYEARGVFVVRSVWGFAVVIDVGDVLSLYLVGQAVPETGHC